MQENQQQIVVAAAAAAGHAVAAGQLSNSCKQFVSVLQILIKFNTKLNISKLAMHLCKRLILNNSEIRLTAKYTNTSVSSMLTYSGIFFVKSSLLCCSTCGCSCSNSRYIRSFFHEVPIGKSTGIHPEIEPSENIYHNIYLSLHNQIQVSFMFSVFISVHLGIRKRHSDTSGNAKADISARQTERQRDKQPCW